MTPKNSLFAPQSSVINGLAPSYTGLKILSWVTLTCQFKSGPGHQNPLISMVSGIPADLIADPLNVSKRAQRCGWRHTMTHAFVANFIPDSLSFEQPRKRSFMNIGPQAKSELEGIRSWSAMTLRPVGLRAIFHELVTYE